MQFRSVADMNDVVMANLHRVPRDVEAVVGIPRSGLLPASLVALAHNLPLADLEGFVAGRVLACGRTKQPVAAMDPARMRHVLLVDDSLRTGKAMIQAQTCLREAWPDLRVTTLAVYGVRGKADIADLTFECVPEPRVFQWNVMHHKVLGRACLDIDGILCADPTDAENDDGENYLRFLGAAAPLHRPTRRVHALITSRLEKYRPQTEAWLARHGVEYDTLLMLDLPDAETRRAQKAHGSFKAARYKELTDTALFIESERAQAHEIAVASGKPVLWLPGSAIIYPDGAPPREMRRPVADTRMVRLKRALRTAVGASVYERAKTLLRRPVVAG